MSNNPQPRKDLLDSLTARRLALSIAILAALVGCNRTSQEIAAVHGKVTIDGKPLFQGHVKFAPLANGESINPGKPAWGLIQLDGTYRLTTFKGNDGAVIGEHWVTITNSDEKLPAGVPEFSRLQAPNKAHVAADQDNEINFSFTGGEVKKLREDSR